MGARDRAHGVGPRVSPTGVKAAAIISTYENPGALELVMRSWARQSVPADWIVVADDGSGPETEAVIRRWGAVHVRQEHGTGYGRCKVANAAVLEARARGATWLLFVDGDCLVARDLLERHLEESRPGRFVAGGVIRLPREVTEAVRADDVDSGAFERLAGNKPRYVLPRPIGHVLDRIQHRRAPWKGGNSSAWLEDFVRVGGYDERFGWGLDDKELGYRFENAGVRGFSIRYTAPVYHLWHERPWMDVSVLPEQERMLAETRRTRSARTAHGIR